VPNGSGAIRFEDPRLPLMMAAPTRLKDAPQQLQPFVSVVPHRGVILHQRLLVHRGYRVLEVVVLYPLPQSRLAVLGCFVRWPVKSATRCAMLLLAE